MTGPWHCDTCRTELADDDAHFPHDRRCGAVGCDDGSCSCDRLTCEACCTDCHPPAEIPGQVGLFGGEA